MRHGPVKSKTIDWGGYTLIVTLRYNWWQHISTYPYIVNMLMFNNVWPLVYTFATTKSERYVLIEVQIKWEFGILEGEISVAISGRPTFIKVIFLPEYQTGSRICYPLSPSPAMEINKHSTKCNSLQSYWVRLYRERLHCEGPTGWGKHGQI